MKLFFNSVLKDSNLRAAQNISAAHALNDLNVLECK